MVRCCNIDLLLCEESGVLVATSNDIPGLVLEAETFGGTLDALMECAPDLIRETPGSSPDGRWRFSFTPTRHPVLRSCAMETTLAAAAC